MPPFGKFEGRLAVVTGAASGIGQALVHQLVRRGVHVAAIDLNSAALDAAVRDAQRLDPAIRVTGHVCDVADRDAVLRAQREVAGAHDADAVHLLFNNAGAVGGMFWVIEAADTDAAVEWATKASAALRGRIEVRALQEEPEA